MLKVAIIGSITALSSQRVKLNFCRNTFKVLFLPCTIGMRGHVSLISVTVLGRDFNIIEGKLFFDTILDEIVESYIILVRDCCFLVK